MEFKTRLLFLHPFKANVFRHLSGAGILVQTECGTTMTVVDEILCPSYPSPVPLLTHHNVYIYLDGRILMSALSVDCSTNVGTVIK